MSESPEKSMEISEPERSMEMPEPERSMEMPEPESSGENMSEPPKMSEPERSGENMSGIIQALDVLCTSGSSRVRQTRKRPSVGSVSPPKPCETDSDGSEPPSKKSTSLDGSCTPSTSSQSDISSKEDCYFSEKSTSTSAAYDPEIAHYLSLEFWNKCEYAFIEETKKAVGEDFNPYNISVGMKGIHREFSEAAIKRASDIYRPMVNLKVFMDTYPFKAVKVLPLPSFLEVTDEEIGKICQTMFSDIPVSSTSVQPKTMKEAEERLKVLWAHAHQMVNVGIFIGGRIMQIAYDIVMSKTRIKSCMMFTEHLLETVMKIRRDCAYLMKECEGLIAVSDVTFISKVNARIGMITYQMLSEIITLNLYLHEKCKHQIENEE